MTLGCSISQVMIPRNRAGRLIKSDFAASFPFAESESGKRMLLHHISVHDALVPCP